MKTKGTLAFLAAGALTLACAGQKPAADTASAGGLAPPDTLKAAPAPEPDSVALLKKATFKGAATKGAPTGVNATPGATGATGATGRILGRDSVRMGPIIAIPAIPDTGKKRPPR